MKNDSNLQDRDPNPLFGKVKKKSQERTKDLNPQRKDPNPFMLRQLLTEMKA